MSELLDISNWNQRPWFSTGGTRAKRYLHNPADDKTYYFKRSADKYPFEFWSEIIAYELGKIIQFDVLEYKVAVFEDEIGCVSQSMIDPDKEELIEGGKYLQAFDPSFSPEERALRDRYTFQLIENALDTYKLSDFMDKVLEVIVFDALIGNSDRHQENWAFIGNYSTITKSLSEVEAAFNSPDSHSLPRWLKKMLSFSFVKKSHGMVFRPEVSDMYVRNRKNIRFAPIYDSGSSLCRECAPEKIESMFKNQAESESYLKKGLSEIHWENQKINHFDLISKILATTHGAKLRGIIEKAVSNYKPDQLQKAVEEMDGAVNEPFIGVKLSKNRKELIVNLVTLRVQKLREIIR